MPFPVQRIQTDRGGEFFAESMQRRLMSECIRFRPIPPRYPHLNGKVERSQLTDCNEFWCHHAPTEDEIDQRTGKVLSHAPVHHLKLELKGVSATLADEPSVTMVNMPRPNRFTMLSAIPNFTARSL